MKHLLMKPFPLAALAISGASLVHGQLISQARPTLSLSPSVVMAKGTFGQSLTQTLTMSNETPADFAFEMVANDVIIKDGKRVFVPMGETPHSIAGSAVFSMNSGVVKSNSTLSVDVRVTIPAETEVRAIVVIFHGVTGIAKDADAVGITASLGTLMTFQLGGPLKVEAESARVMSAGSSSNLNAAVWLKNPGAEPIMPEGVAAFLNPAGALVGRARFPAQRLLPGERLEFTAEYPGGLPSGAYRVLCSFRYEDKDMTVETNFSVP
jgi:hypothetical protein